MNNASDREVAVRDPKALRSQFWRDSFLGAKQKSFQLREIKVSVWLNGDEAPEGGPSGGGSEVLGRINPFERHLDSVRAANCDSRHGRTGERCAGFVGPVLEVLLGHLRIVGD